MYLRLQWVRPIVRGRLSRLEIGLAGASLSVCAAKTWSLHVIWSVPLLVLCAPREKSFSYLMIMSY